MLDQIEIISCKELTSCKDVLISDSTLLEGSVTANTLFEDIFLFFFVTMHRSSGYLNAWHWTLKTLLSFYSVKRKNLRKQTITKQQISYGNMDKGKSIYSNKTA